MGIKVFLFILSLGFVLFLMSMTFFSGGNISDFNLNLNFPKNGDFYVYNSGSGVYKESEKEIGNTDFYLKRYNLLNNILSDSKNNYDLKKSTLSDQINLKEGVYFMFLGESKKYKVIGKGFTADFVGPIKIYIDTKSQSKTTILSFDNLVELSLIGLEDNKEKTKVYIYPHMSFSFKPTLNKILLNADLLRISQINNIDFLNNRIFFDENFDLSFFDENIINYISYIKNIYFTNNYNTTLFDKFDKTIYDYLKKYAIIFINDEKKISYYKDLIYMELLDIDKGNNLGKYDNIIGYFNSLKSINKKEYENMLEFILYLRIKNIFDNDDYSKKVKKLEEIDLIYANISGGKLVKSDYNLYTTFNSYDFGNNESIFKGVSDFSKNYITDNGLKLNDNIISGYDLGKNIKFGYYILFLEKFLKSTFTYSTLNDNDMKNIFNLFGIYSQLSVSNYMNGDENKKKTIIILNLSLLKELEKFLRNVFFEKELGENDIVIKKLSLDPSSLKILEDNLNGLFTFFNDNKFIFDEVNEKDFLYITDYLGTKEILLDYVEALKNYDKYKLEKNNLWGVNTFSGFLDDNKDNFTIENINLYLSSFNGLSSDVYKITTTDNKVYSVVMTLGGKDITYDLYPSNDFSIKNIYIDGVKSNLSYSLEERREKLGDKFKDFFILTFLNIGKDNANSSGEILEESTGGLTAEERNKELFKKNKLLGNNGEFISLKSFTDIDYDNVIIALNNGKYEISIDNLDVFFKDTLNNNGMNFSSKYILDDVNHYFTNIKIKLYKKNNIDNGNIIYGLGNTEITVKGNLKINLFKNYVYEILTYYDNMLSVYNVLKNKFTDISITIEINKIIKFNFIYNDKNFEISLYKDNIVSIKENGIEKITTPFIYTSLQKNINLLLNN